jgi:Cu-Zn family superoxide dismutase
MGNTTRRGMRVGAATALLAGAALTVASLTAGGPASGQGWEAKAVLRDATGARVGTVRFEGDARGTEVKVVVDGITVGLDAFHGLHLHANETGGPCSPAEPVFGNVGAHWSPSGAVHGHHEGDLPSLLVQADGTGSARSVTQRFEPTELGGRAVILHAGPDNLANVPDRYSTGTPAVPGPDAATKGTGDSGGRIACGIIVVD